MEEETKVDDGLVIASDDSVEVSTEPQEVFDPNRAQRRAMAKQSRTFMQKMRKIKMLFAHRKDVSDSRIARLNRINKRKEQKENAKQNKELVA